MEIKNSQEALMTVQKEERGFQQKKFFHPRLFGQKDPSNLSELTGSVCCDEIKHVFSGIAKGAARIPQKRNKIFSM